MAAKKTPAKKTTAKKSTAPKGATPTKKTATKKTAAKKTAAKKAPAKKAAASGAGTKKGSTAKPAARKTAAPKGTAKTASAKKTAATKAATPKPTSKPSKPKSSAKSANGVAAKPVKSTEVFSAHFLDEQRKALVTQRATYERQSRSLRDEAASLVEDFQSGDVQFDEESGEGDTLNVQREQDLMMSSQALSAIEEIDHALAKFATDTYGICEVSGTPIPKARLEAIPWARERVEYKVGGLTSR